MATSSDSAAHRAVIQFCADLGMTPVQTHKHMTSVERHKNVSRALVYKWHHKFTDGEVENKEIARKGRPISLDTDVIKQVRTVIDDDRRQTVREVSERMGISKSSVHRILSVDLNMSRVCARWVPRLLKTEEKERRVSASREFLRRHQADDTFLDRIVTTDETWLHYFEPEGKRQSSVWKTPGTPPPKKAKMMKSLGKVMVIVFLDRRGMILVHSVPAGQTVNAEYYSKVVRRDLLNALRKKRPEMYREPETILFHQDNAPAHTASKTQTELDVLGFERVIHPPYSPDLAPLDFAYFPLLKENLRGQRFSDKDELLCETIKFNRKLAPAWFRSVFSKWVRRHERCIECKGEYFEKE